MAMAETQYIWVSIDGEVTLWRGTTEQFALRQRAGLHLGASEEWDALPEREQTARIAARRREWQQTPF